MSTELNGATLAKADDTPRVVSRRRASEMLGVSQSQVRRHEEAGRLRAERVEIAPRRVRVRIPLADVVALRDELRAREGGAAPARRPRAWSREEGRLAARAFALLREGATHDRMVVELEVTPEQARVYRREYLRTFEAEDREREEDRRRREEVRRQRDHDRKVAREDREARAAAAARRARREGAPPPAGTRVPPNETESAPRLTLPPLRTS